MNVLGKITSRIGVRMNDSPSKHELDRIEPACKDLYDKWVAAWRAQYVIGTPIDLFSFLALPEDHVECLYVEPGSLVKCVEDGDYVLVTGYGMTYNRVTLKGTDAQGRNRVLGAEDFLPSEIPSGIVDIVKQQLLKKCPLMRGGCKEEQDETKED